MATLKLRVDVAPLEGLAARIDRLIEGAQINLGAVAAVNDVIRRADASIRAGENAGINLTNAYVQSKTDLVLATGKPKAEMVTRGDLTIMGHYFLATQPGGGALRRAGPRAGQRNAGVHYEVKRGQPAFEPQWFMMRLRQGTRAGDKFGAFIRTGPSTVKHIYAVSPYSLARFQIGAQASDIEEDLSKTATAEISKRINEALK